MMRSRLHRRAVFLLTAVFLLATPLDGRAEGLFTGFIGSTFGGDTVEGGTSTYGLALAGSAGGVIGFEFDLARTADAFGGDADTVDSSLTTAMGNIVVGVGGPVRPYATAGVGMIRAAFEGPPDISVESRKFGMNFGGGVTGFFTEHVGLRGDVRFFRAVSESDDLVDIDIDTVDFWRAAVGVAVRW